ncbi:iron chelate uptake ABC transporter family permease subunit [Agromyces atrinae]|uniref:FecCD family ABC transporter permease n=1 Tax=Agromyces atrinae TaxID=592376 RepID=UPI001F59B393|nr:iron chelate uptake ABC transporter family permease subunit [Agromyces atrinae]MCI2958454.1 iron chelate uptake ABC transporter family permease subunit [Agromyces atrinae]
MTGTVRFAHRRLVLGGRRAHVVVRVRSLTVAVVACAITAVLLVLALALGDFPLAPSDVVGALIGTTDGLPRTVVLEWRLPRAAAAIVFGAALAVAGALFQTITRNPLASPDIIGLANGSFTGMLIALIVLGGSWPLLVTGSLLGGLVAALVIVLLSAHDGLQGFRFIVIGIGVSAMLAAFNTWLLLRAELETALFAAAWGAGSLNSVSATTAWPAIALLVVILALLPLVTRPLQQLGLGDDVARSTGVLVRRSRIGVLVIAVALVSVVTSIAGPIAFVSLAAPQITRRLTGTADIPLVPTLFVGGALLLAADIIAQHVIPLTVPVGVVTVVCGGAYLVWLLAREIRRAP